MPSKRKPAKAGEDDGSDAALDKVRAAQEAKVRMNTHKKRRMEKRKAIENSSSQKLAAIKAEITKTKEDYDNKVFHATHERLAAMSKAKKGLDETERAIMDTLEEIRAEGTNLAAELDLLYLKQREVVGDGRH